jgi:hypothetical protein
MSDALIPAGTRVGHVHLKVADLERALGFYCGVLSFELTQRFGDQAAFVSAGGYHHHIGLSTWESKGGSPPAPGTTGLFHTAILYPTRTALADALHRLRGAGMASARRCTCAIPTRTEWNFIGIGSRRIGRAIQTVALPCSRASSISTISFVILKRYRTNDPESRETDSPQSTTQVRKAGMDLTSSGEATI